MDAVLNLGLPAPLDIQVSGTNPGGDHEVAHEIAGEIRALPGVSDVLRAAGHRLPLAEAGHRSRCAPASSD